MVIYIKKIRLNVKIFIKRVNLFEKIINSIMHKFKGGNNERSIERA
jgi:hypothetical protein